MAGQFPALGVAAGDDLEDRIITQHVVVVLVGVVGQDAIDPHADHFGKGVLGGILPARVVQGRGELCGQADPLVELADRQQARVTGQLGRFRADDHCLLGEEVQ